MRVARILALVVVLSGGAADEITMRWNRESFDRMALMPRVLRGGAGGHTRLTLLGRTYDHPIFVAPVAYQKLADPAGECATAAAAEALAACMVLSTESSIAMEDVARAGATCRWFQLYLQPERQATPRSTPASSYFQAASAAKTGVST